ncbi:MAG: hypothetical protein ACFBQW_08590 [Sphingomonadaceae bacterium]
MADATKQVAKAILREVPVTNLRSFLADVSRFDDDTGNGNGCGGGCNIGNNCIDRFGHSDISRDDFRRALQQGRELQVALRDQAKKALGEI